MDGWIVWGMGLVGGYDCVWDRIEGGSVYECGIAGGNVYACGRLMALRVYTISVLYVCGMFINPSYIPHI